MYGQDCSLSVFLRTIYITAQQYLLLSVQKLPTLLVQYIKIKATCYSTSQMLKASLGKKIKQKLGNAGTIFFLQQKHTCCQQIMVISQFVVRKGKVQSVNSRCSYIWNILDVNFLTFKIMRQICSQCTYTSLALIAPAIDANYLHCRCLSRINPYHVNYGQINLRCSPGVNSFQNVRSSIDALLFCPILFLYKHTLGHHRLINKTSRVQSRFQ